MVLKFFSRMVLIGVFVLAVYPQVAFSEHEADHRYTVLGYVLDDQKQGVSNSSVKILLDGKLIGQNTTDANGFYKARLHLHDPDYGKELEIASAKGNGKVKIDFTLGNKEKERLHHINFIDGVLTEGELSVSGLPQWVYFAVGGLLLVIIVVAVGKNIGKSKRKKKSKQKKKKT